MEIQKKHIWRLAGASIWFGKLYLLHFDTIEYNIWYANEFFPHTNYYSYQILKVSMRPFYITLCSNSMEQQKKSYCVSQSFCMAIEKWKLLKINLFSLIFSKHSNVVCTFLHIYVDYIFSLNDIWCNLNVYRKRTFI